MSVVETGRSRLTWSSDGARITKEPTVVWDAHPRLFLNEQKVMAMLEADPPPLRVPRMLASRRGRSLVTEVIDGEQLGPKFPLALDDRDIDDVLLLVDRLRSYRPRRRWFRRFDVDGRIQRSPLDPKARDLVRRAVLRHPPRLRFAHGDVTARNLLRASSSELVLIDWEWAGLYPVGYDRAFFWFSLIDVPGGRDRAAQWDEPWFALSALFIQLFHLGMWRARAPEPFVVAHRATLDELLERVRSFA